MSITRIIKGTNNVITGGDHNIYSKGNIIITAHKSVTQTGVEMGVSYIDPKTLPLPEHKPVKLATFTTGEKYAIRSFIQGNFDGSPDGYKPGNTGIELNSNGADALDENGNMKPALNGKVPFGINWEASTINKQDWTKSIYIPSQQPFYNSPNRYNGDPSTIIDPKEICFLVSSFAGTRFQGMAQGDIGYIERLDPKTGEVMNVKDLKTGEVHTGIYCILADSGYVKVNNSIVTDPTTKKPIADRRNTEISYRATQALGLTLSGEIYVEKKTFERYVNLYGEEGVNKVTNPRYKKIKSYNAKNEPIIEHVESVKANSTHIINLDYLINTYNLPHDVRIITTPTEARDGIIENMQQGVESFKLIGVNDRDSQAILRIWIFLHSEDEWAHKQNAIDAVGKKYHDALIIDKKQETDYQPFIDSNNPKFSSTDKIAG